VITEQINQLINQTVHYTTPVKTRANDIHVYGNL